MAIIYNGTTISQDHTIKYNDQDLAEVWVCDTSTACCTKVWSKNRGLRIVRPAQQQVYCCEYPLQGENVWSCLGEGQGRVRWNRNGDYEYRNDGETAEFNTNICVYNYTDSPVEIHFDVSQVQYDAVACVPDEGVDSLIIRNPDSTPVFTIPPHTVCAPITRTVSVCCCQETYIGGNQYDNCPSSICLVGSSGYCFSVCQNGTRLLHRCMNCTTDCCLIP